MRNLKNWLLVSAIMLSALSAWALEPPESDNKPQQENSNPAVSFRMDCATAETNEDMAVNNVRARLTTGGDVWWDRNDGLYVVPKVQPGETPVSSIFAGAVWLGGVDPGGSLKVACQAYGNGSGNSDFWPGPLTKDEGSTSQDTCALWDRFFRVTADEINLHLALYAQSLNGIPYTEDQIPAGVKAWPGRGNPFFADVNNFELPNTNQGLAGFHDTNEGEGGIYNPLEGDYPIIEIRGCEEDLPPPPDEMIFWIYNDGGNTHTETGGIPILMEIQVQAFAYATNDEINDMTFQRYKLINRAQENIDSMFFAMWVDPDLGCDADDFVGCDTMRSLAYVYNSDAADGEPGITCPSGAATYETDIPALGIDYFRGPLDENREEIGMSSFTYYHRGDVSPEPGTGDPGIAIEYYRYLSGSWADGTPFTYGGIGKGGTEQVNYAFTEPPNSNGWSMCTPDPTIEGESPLPASDRRTIQASGPFTLQPGSINELIIGVVWAADFNYPCPDLSRLFFADDIAQSLFDNCFKINNGPDAPDVDWIELDQEIIAVFTNDTSGFITNNSFELYNEIDVRAPEALEDSVKTYIFEGYLLYQMKGSQVTTAELDNPEKARLIRQVDIKNGVQQIFNWSALGDAATPDHIEETIWIPEEQVNGMNDGIRHTFRITEDVFAEGDSRLINHKKYYFRALAYGFNDFESFDPATGTGQRASFIAGRRRIGERPNGQNDFYTVIPRPITDRNLNAEYGDGAQITRLDGVGVGNNFVDVTAETRDAIFNGDIDGRITYREGRGPVDVTIYDPLEVKDGIYELTFIDDNLDDDILDAETRWQLTSVSDPSSPIFSEATIEKLNEQIVGRYGFTLTIGQTTDAGCIGFDEPCIENPENGAIGYEAEYTTSGAQWLNIVPDDFSYSAPENIYEVGAIQVFNFAQTGIGEAESDFDLFQGLSTGIGGFTPYWLTNDDLANQIVTPSWKNSFNGLVLNSKPREEFLSELANIDIVFTSDKTKWSRCVVVESRNHLYNTVLLPNVNQVPVAEGDAKMFDLRQTKSVTKEAGADGLPVEDTAETRDGFGWFPGYAYNVETGKRVNIFFGENSAYAPEYGNLDLFENGAPTGRDMMFNPTSQVYLDQDFSLIGIPNIYNYVAGGQHFVYVTNEEYDGCEEIYADLAGSEINKRKATARIQWAGLPVLNEGTRMSSYAEGLIPADVIAKLRVDNPYAVEIGTGDFNGYPSYEFTISGKQANDLSQPGIDSALAMINVVPNPYYAYSAYENGANNQVVKISNLPAKCVVTIYSLDGKFIRSYNRDEVPRSPKGSGIPGRQIVPDLDWDMKNNKGIPIASGVYLIHVDARDSGWGERTIKWFGINRQFDPARI